MNKKSLTAFMAVITASAVIAIAANGADKKTERLWKAKCAACHGTDGKGKTSMGGRMGIADMSKAEWQKISDLQIRETIKKGVKRNKNGKSQNMTAFTELTAEQIESFVAFIRGLKK